MNTLPHRCSSQAPQVTDPYGLELIGIKWLPALNNSQAKELTPYEVRNLQNLSPLPLCSRFVTPDLCLYEGWTV